MRLDPATETPTPALTASPATPLASQLVTFDASASKPPAFGTITHYEWDLDGNGTFETDGGTSSTISRRFAQAGTETVRVRVSASVGMSATEAITLNIGTPYTFTSAMPGLVVTGQPVTFDAGPSAMEGSDIERFQWDFDGDGTYETDTGTTSSVQHAYATPGVFTASVRVTRSGGRVDSATAPVEVRLAPPAGEVGVSINGGAFATNDPHVTLSLVWPVNADSLLASNDGGFGDAGSTQVFPVAPEVGWTLPSAGAERLPKTVYVRFRVSGTSGSETYTDDIVLDQDAPAVTSAQASHRVLRVKALDGNTGVASLIVTRPHAKLPLKTKQLAPAGSQASTRVTTTVQLPRGLRRAYVRAVDAVGNKSRWRWIKFR
jgi:PKD repeat protein